MIIKLEQKEVGEPDMSPEMVLISAPLLGAVVECLRLDEETMRRHLDLLDGREKMRDATIDALMERISTMAEVNANNVKIIEYQKKEIANYEEKERLNAMLAKAKSGNQDEYVVEPKSSDDAVTAPEMAAGENGIKETMSSVQDSTND